MSDSDYRVRTRLDFPRNVVEVHILRRHPEETNGYAEARGLLNGSLTFEPVPPNVESLPLVRLPRVVAEKLRDELLRELGPPTTQLFGATTTILESPEEIDRERLDRILDAVADQIRQGGAI